MSESTPDYSTIVTAINDLKAEVTKIGAVATEVGKVSKAIENLQNAMVGTEGALTRLNASLAPIEHLVALTDSSDGATNNLARIVNGVSALSTQLTKDQELVKALNAIQSKIGDIKITTTGGSSSSDDSGSIVGTLLKKVISWLA